MRVARVALAIGGLVLAGCSAAPAGPPASEAAPTSTAATTSAPTTSVATTTAAPRPAVDPCAGVTGCVRVASVDVDGDGARDNVGITVTRDAPPPQVAFGKATITVLVSHDGAVVTTQVDSPGVLAGDGGLRDAYVGAYKISRDSGADLVLHTQLGGGSAEQFVVVGWDGAGLAVVPAPPAGMSVTNPKVGVWLLASSHGSRDTVSCGVGAGVTVQRLSAASQEGEPIPGGGVRESNHFAFVDGQWEPTGSENVPDTTFSYDFDPNTQTFDCADQGR